MVTLTLKLCHQTSLVKPLGASMSKAVNVNIRNFISGVFSIPCEQLVSATLPERETTASYFAGNHYTAGSPISSPKRSSYLTECTRKRQNKFTNLIYSSLAVDGSTLKETSGWSLWFLSQEALETPTACRVYFPRKRRCNSS